MKKFATFVFILIGISCPSWASEVNTASILHDFEIIAFGSEYQRKTWKGLRKWKSPIRIGLQGKYPGYLEDDILQFTTDLTAITNHQIELYYSKKMQKNRSLAKDFNKNKVNVIVYYEPLHNIRKKVGKYFKDRPHELDIILKEATCFAKFFTRRLEIRAAIVVIPDHHPRRVVRACVVEEIAQIMGLPNDSNLVGESIFKDRGRHNELTPHDRLLLKILYDKRLHFGMPRKETLEKIREFLPEIIQNAHN
jgi:hypothetical protein